MNRVSHIFGGIDEPHDIQLSELQEDFHRLGIYIDPSCKIASSILKRLIAYINRILSPPTSEQSLALKELMSCRPVISLDTSKWLDAIPDPRVTRNFNITIGAKCEIGEGVFLYEGISIGQNTIIGKGTELTPGISIGKNCKIGEYVDINGGCKIGDNTEIEDCTIFDTHTVVPPNSIVYHHGHDDIGSKIAIIREKLSVIKPAASEKVKD